MRVPWLRVALASNIVSSVCSGSVNLCVLTVMSVGVVAVSHPRSLLLSVADVIVHRRPAISFDHAFYFVLSFVFVQRHQKSP